MSFPHFYNADPKLLEKVIGLSPNQEKHEFYIDIEPNTGIALQVRGRFQLNVLIQPVNHTTGQWFSNLRYPLMPIVTFDRNGDVTQDEADDVRKIYTIKTLKTAIFWGGLVLGALLGLTGGFMVRNANKNENNDEKRLRLL